MQQLIEETDVLCVGGGIAGLMAAIRARELGASVTVVEKGNTLSSGKGGVGNDHFLCYLPEVHSQDLNAFIDAIMETQQADNFRGLGMSRVRAHLSKTADIVRMWDSWGIPMKYKGSYEFAGHGYPGSLLFMLKYEGRYQKAILTGEALKRGIKIINRVMVTDLLGGSRVTGAVGMGTRDEKVIIFKAKSVFLGTGGTTRMYPGPTAGMINNHRFPMSVAADGRALAYRLGAELQDLERYKLHCGPKYFARSGQATWIGVYRDPQGNPIGPFITKPERKYGDTTPEVNKGIFGEYTRAGKGPVYMDGKGMSEEDYDYMVHWLTNEGNTAIVNHMKEENIDLRKTPVEFMTYNIGSDGRINVDKDCKTSVPGLYTAGDEVANGISNASVFGWFGGENAAKFARESGAVELSNSEIEQAARTTGLLKDIKNRSEGTGWKEANFALMQVMNDYAGRIRSASMLEAGLDNLRRLKAKASSTLVANNQHELQRCFEVLNLFDVGELVFVAAIERKETRGTHVRVDYPLTNPRLNKKMLAVKMLDGKPVTEWKDI